MKTLAAIFLLVMVGTSLEARAEGESDVERTQLLVLGVSRNHAGLVEDARTMAESLGYAFSDRGLVFDDDKGLHWPDDDADEMWAGGYFQRRFDNECGGAEKKGCITVERSDAYDGLKPGYLVIVGGLLGDDEAKARLGEVRRVVKDAYLVETSVYRGCIH